MRQYKHPFPDSRIIPLYLLDKRSRDLSGERFGLLTATGVVHKEHVSQKTRGNSWLFKCDCGGETIARICDIASGRQKSCGCLRNACTKQRMTTHGMGHTKTYKTWLCMAQRCYNPKHKEFRSYGGRGINVVLRWYDRENLEQSYLNFLEDMGERPFVKAQIDRIDNNKGYSPENCRWVTPKQNSNNTRRTVFATVDGITRSVSDWADITGIPVQRIRNAVHKGKDVELIILSH